jgi:hypothetical protein
LVAPKAFITFGSNTVPIRKVPVSMEDLWIPPTVVLFDLKPAPRAKRRVNACHLRRTAIARLSEAAHEKGTKTPTTSVTVSTRN